MIDYADEIVAACALLGSQLCRMGIGRLASYNAQRRQEIETLDAQGRQILTLVGQPSEGKK